MSAREHPDLPWLPAAEAILQAAIEGDLMKAGDAIGDALDKYGSEVLPGFAMAWVDTLRAHIGVPIGATVHTHHICATHDHETDTPPADVAWAGRIITARIGRDQAAFMVLLEEANNEGWADKITELILVVAQTINVAAQRPVAVRRGAAFGVRPQVAHTHGLDNVRPPV